MKALPYEVNNDETLVTITTLLVEEVENAQIFGTYDVAKVRTTTTLLITSIDKKKTKIMKRLIENLGEGDDEEDVQAEKG